MQSSVYKSSSNQSKSSLLYSCMLKSCVPNRLRNISRYLYGFANALFKWVYKCLLHEEKRVQISNNPHPNPLNFTWQHIRTPCNSISWILCRVFFLNCLWNLKVTRFERLKEELFSFHSQSNKVWTIIKLFSSYILDPILPSLHNKVSAWAN